MVADRLEEYHRIGIDEFILSGHTHVEEGYWFAEGVKPILRAKGIYGDDVLPGRRWPRPELFGENRATRVGGGS